MADTDQNDHELTEEEAAKRRDEALKRALGTPPKPRKSKPKGNKGKREEAETSPRPFSPKT